MKQVAELINNQNLNYSDQTTSIGETDKRFINKLFDELSSIFPAWKQAFESEAQVRNAKRVWFKALVENKVTKPEQIKQGLSYAVKEASPFLPSVGMFIEWCKVGENSLPDFPTLKIDNQTKPETLETEIQKMKEALS